MAHHTLNAEEAFSLQLINCISIKNNIEFQRILKNVDPKNYFDDYGMTLLHHAVIFDNAEIAQYLIDRGCDVNTTNRYGISPLSFSIEMKHSSVTKVLLAANNVDIYHRNQCIKSPLQTILSPKTYQDVDIVMTFLKMVKKDNHGSSIATAKSLINAKCPLPRALLLKDVSITRYMLEHRCSIKDVDYDDDTALHYAVRSMDFEHVKLLIAWRADVNAVNNKRQTALHLYQMNLDLGHEILRTLLKYGANLVTLDTSGYMSLTRIFGCAKRATIKAIFEYDIDLYATNADGTTLLHHAAYNENPGVIEEFRGRNFHVNARDVRGETALWYAVEVVNPESLKFLLENGADWRILDNVGYTAFFQGFYVWVDMKEKTKNCLRCIDIFLQYGVDVDCVDSRGRTIFDYALKYQHFVLVKPILEYQAMGELIGRPILTSELFLLKIDLHKKFRSYFEFCKMKIEKMKKTVIFQKVTLFKFLVGSKGQLENYARNQNLVERLRKVTYGMRSSNVFFVKYLRQRIDKAIQMAKLRKKAETGLSKIEGLDNKIHVIQKILLYFEDKDLRNICLI